MIEQKTYHETVLEAAKEVFETMIFMEIEPSQKLPSSGRRFIDGIHYVQGRFEGCMVISMTWPCARIIARNMLALEPEADITDEETCDAIGEVSNMVMGSIKSRLQDTYSSIEVSIPSVITGKNLTGPNIEGAERICVPVSIDEDQSAGFSLLSRRRKGSSQFMETKPWHLRPLLFGEYAPNAKHQCYACLL